uniref:Secreted protein n=1 Tax=Ixodes ricinus TaxID=34613 RepID=A0A6B0UNX0_IXORI
MLLLCLTTLYLLCSMNHACCVTCNFASCFIESFYFILHFTLLNVEVAVALCLLFIFIFLLSICHVLLNVFIALLNCWGAGTLSGFMPLSLPPGRKNSPNKIKNEKENLFHVWAFYNCSFF